MESLHIVGYSFSMGRGRTILVSVVLLLMLFTLTNCERPAQQVPLRTLSARELYPRAMERAQQWKPDAYLADIRVDVLSEEDFNRQLGMSFGFESPSDDRQSLLIFYREDSDKLEAEIVDHEIPIQVRNPVALEDWPVDSLKALEIAQDNGGNEFLAGHDPDLMTLYLERVQNVPGADLQWRVSFWDWSTQEILWVMLDPQTGQVIEVERQPPR